MLVLSEGKDSRHAGIEREIQGMLVLSEGFKACWY